MTFSDPLVDFVRAWEGLKLTPSADPLVPGIVDVGYGHVIRPGEQRRRITAEEAVMLLEWDLNITAAGVDSLVKVRLAQCQFDELVAFAFNVGLDIDDDPIAEGLGDSTLLKRVNEGAFEAASAQFTLWCHANGHVVRGLENRRIAEQAMWSHGDYTGRP